MIICLPPWHKRGNKIESLGWGLPTNNSPVVGGAPGYGFISSQCTPGALGVLLMYIVIFLCFFWCNLVMWLFFKANLMLINHPHRPCLAKSECAAVTGIFHKCHNASLCPRRTLPGSAGFLPDSTPLISVFTMSPTHHSWQDICAAPAHPRMIFLYHSSVHNNASELIIYSAHRLLQTPLDHTTT